MKRLSAWLIGPLMLTTTAIVTGPASTATASTVVPHVVAGNYTMYEVWGPKGHDSFSMTLYRDHTGTDHFGDSIVWSLADDKSFEMTFDDGLYHYIGMKTRAGLNNARHPGTMSNINGGHGTWYAVKAG